MLTKSASYNLLHSEGLQTRWRASAATNFIRRKNRFRFSYIYILATVLLILIVYISLPQTKKNLVGASYADATVQLHSLPSIHYNATYPLTRPIVNPHSHSTMYKIGIIADLDKLSKAKTPHSWKSYLKQGYLIVGPSSTNFELKWDAPETEISSGYSLKGERVCERCPVGIQLDLVTLLIVLLFFLTYLYYLYNYFQAEEWNSAKL